MSEHEIKELAEMESKVKSILAEEGIALTEDELICVVGGGAAAATKKPVPKKPTPIRK